MAVRLLKAALIALALFGGYTLLPAAPVAPEPAALRQGMVNATVRVEVGESSGSGTFVTASRVLTNHHVVGEAKAVILRAWITEGARTYPVIFSGIVIASDAQADLALVEIVGTWPGAVAALAADGAVAGEPVWVAGAPLKKRVHVVDGTVSLPVDDDLLHGMRHLVASAPVVPGNSGGGTWRWNAGKGRYELLAVVRAVATVGFGSPVPHLGYHIPLPIVRAFLAKHGVEL